MHRQTMATGERSGADRTEPAIGRTTRRKREHKATADDLDLSAPVELIALSVKERAARCRLLGTSRAITLRASCLWEVVPGEIVTVTPRKQWSYAGHPYLSGGIESARLDVRALGLVPLRLKDRGSWDPEEEYWGEEDEPIEEWAKPIIARGPRPAFEMEQVLPGEDLDDPFADPITESNDLKDAGARAEAHRILMDLCQVDLRCLDAHAHLGNFVFDHSPKDAIRHYEVGVRIRELSLGEGFEGVLPVGPHRQSPVSALPARVRTVPLAAGPLRRRRVCLREDAVAQPVRQPGRPVPHRHGQGTKDMG